MKKLLTTGLVLAAIALQARVYHVTTSCGVQGNLTVADNATMDQISQAVSQYNYNNCGVRPTKITFSINP